MEKRFPGGGSADSGSIQWKDENNPASVLILSLEEMPLTFGTKVNCFFFGRRSKLCLICFSFFSFFFSWLHEVMRETRRFAPVWSRCVNLILNPTKLALFVTAVHWTPNEALILGVKMTHIYRVCQINAKSVTFIVKFIVLFDTSAKSLPLAAAFSPY